MNPKDNFIKSLGNKIQNFSLAPQAGKSTQNMTYANSVSSNGATSPNMTYANQNMSKVTSPVVKPVTPPVIKSGTPTITTPEKPVLSPDAQNYAQFLYDTKTGARTDYGASMGAKDMLGGKEVTAPTPTAPVVQPESPYKKYLDAMTSDAQRVADIKSQSEGKEYEARKLYSKTLDTPGGLVSGARDSASMISRRGNEELADLALRESAAARTAGISQEAYKQFSEENKPISVGGQLYQKQDDGTYKSVAGGDGAEGFTLGKDQVRYDAKGNVIATGTGSGTGSTEAPTIKTFGQTDYSWNADTKQWDPVVTSDTSPQAKIDKASKLLTDITDLKNTKGFESAVGAKGLSSLFGLKGQPIAGTKAADYTARLNSIKGQLTLENMGVMKGVLSDSDIKIITQASTALSPDMSEAEFKKELDKIESVMKKVVEKGGQGTTGISPDEEAYLRSKGYGDAEINSLKGNVGKTSASNIPQQNKNPGNVKAGGLADSLAVGVDKQGHLIFPDETTGFKALTMDVQAKVNGQSKFLPANPTIAQLGKVYAEDPNWPKSVAKILGVTPLTPTAQIPINNLVQAIAKQEGYFA